MRPDAPLAPGMHRVALGVEYDGRPFCGWQTQPDASNVQDRLEHALEKFLLQPTPTICAGRTDTGVHALSQVVHIDVDCLRGENNYVRALNTFLPDSISVLWAREVDSDFSARFSAMSRTYAYWLYNAPVRSPVFHGRTGWVWRDCDEAKMREGARHLLGEHDFTSFRSADCQAASPVRTVESIEIRRFGSLIGIEIKANAFLQHMVRNIVGTLVYVGVGREPADWVKTVLDARDRSLAAPTFDAAGLYLTGVCYPEQYKLPSHAAGPFAPFGALHHE